MLPRYELSLKQSVEGVKPRSSPLVEEALNLGCVIRSVVPSGSSFSVLPPSAGGSAVVGVAIPPSRRLLPQGHRFFGDCVREQEARLIEWAIKRFYPDCWFFTQTFHYEIIPAKALRFHRMFTARLAQSKSDLTGCKQLTYLSCGEWQQRDVYHYHSIFFGRGLAQLSRKSWESRWLKLSGGFGSCYGAELRAAPYLAKHNSKRYGDIQIGGDWRGLKLPRGLSRCCFTPALDSVALLRMIES
jgi:hypothetical protein